MEHQQLTYRVGPHAFCIRSYTSACTAELLPSFRDFQIDRMNEEEEPLFTLRLCEEGFPQETNNATPLQEVSFNWEDAQCEILQVAKDTYLIAITPHSGEETFHMESADDFRNSLVYLPPCEPATARFVLNNFLMMLYAFTAVHRCTLLMHASVVVKEGAGYLFLGKSGTGKSTHTQLWLKHLEGSHLLNDDNPVVHIECLNDKATVYGSPWSGKTPCYRNESFPVGAFVRLEQAPANEIEKEKTVRAFASLLPSCSCLKQDKKMYTKMIQVVTCLASHVPVFHLKCLPNEEAAQLAWQAIHQ